MDFYEQVPKDFAENLRYRLKLRQRAEKDLRFREALILACRADILFFLSAFCYLHEPRPMKDAEGRTLPEIIPFIPWAHQVPIIRTIRENIGFEDIGCLGGDVGVVSHRGVVRIKDIRKDDLIWDGDNFVSHGGVISRGIKQVIRAYGLTMTPDHLVLTTKGWQRADQGISRATVRMPDSYRWNSSEDEVQVRLRGRKDLPTSRCLEGNSERRESELLSFLSTRNKIDSFARDVKKDWKNKAIQCLGGYGWKVYQGIASCLRLLRWPWHNSMRGMAQIQQLLEGHEGFLLAGFDSGQARQQRSLLSEKLLVGQQEGTSEQHAKQSLGRHYSRRDDCISGRRYSRNNLVVHERKSRHRMDEGEIVAEEVYDILDCGPLNRFVVIGDQPTVVHNCEKARGEGMSWIAVYIALHDWVFAIPGTRMVSIGVVSRNLEMADSPDDPASLGWKFDWALKRLPKWMVGQKFSGKQKSSAVGWRRNMAEHTWRNLQNGSVITCYAATAETGSGGRYTYFLLDELSKFQPGADKDALTSTQQTTKSRLIIGTPYGSEGAYYDVMHEPSSMVKLVLAWENNPTRNRGLYRMVDGKPMAIDRANNPLLPRYDPPNQEVQEMYARLRRKGFRLEKGLRSEWYDKECDRPDANPYNIAQELDRDYGGSMYKIFGEEFFGAIAGAGTVRQPLCRADVSYDDELKATVSKSHNGQLLLWMSLDVKNRPPDHTYVIGCDICTGLGGAYTSNSVMEIIDVTIGEQVGEMAVNTMKPDDFADYCMAVGKWLGGAYLNWERNGGPGSEFTKQVLNRRYTNVFFSSRMFERGKHKIKVPGWYSEDKSKPVMFAEFKQAVVSGALRIRSDLLVKECHQYINVGGRIVHIAVARRAKDKDGKDGPDQGQAHGDRVIALGVAVQAVRDRPINIDRDKDSKILPGSIEERDRMYHESQQDEARGDDWDDRTNWDLMQGTRAGFVFN